MAKKRVQTVEEFDDYLNDEEELEESVEVTVANMAPETYNIVRIVNKIGARVKYPGAVTGKLYIWERAGAVVNVDERDVPDLLTKTLGKKRCCGSANSNFVFEIMKE